MKTSTVWVVQDNGRNNLTLAAKFGEIKTLLPPRLQLQGETKDVVETISNKLKGFSENDCILAAGDPACIALAVTIAAAHAGDGIVTMLKYDRQLNDYYKVMLDLCDFVRTEDYGWDLDHDKY